VAVLNQAQQRLSMLLLAEDRDLPAIIEAAENVRRAEIHCSEKIGRRRK
jgi:hypothetical protein